MGILLRSQIYMYSKNNYDYSNKIIVIMCMILIIVQRRRIKIYDIMMIYTNYCTCNDSNMSLRFQYNRLYA